MQLNMNKPPVLELKNIYKYYIQGNTKIEVLKDINFKVTAGEIVAIIGNSGSGKSTFMHISGLLERANKGVVSIVGHSYIQESKYLKYASEVRLKNIGFVYQYHHLLNDFNTQENVAIPLIISKEKKNKALEKAKEILIDIGLGHRLYNLPGELSGGEKQKVAIARALINNPKIILADEPTGNLDSNSTIEIFDLLLNKAKRSKVAIVVVTHNLLLAQKMDYVYKLNNNNFEIC